MQDNPDISIITPTFNSAPFVDATIDSVVRQTFGRWEMIIVDDGSTDSTIDRVQAWVSRDRRIRLLQNERNLGPGPTRNRGVENRRGRFVAYLDSDDLWLPDKLETQLDFMRQHDSIFSYTSYEIIDDEGRALERRVAAPAELSYEDLLSNTVIGCLTVMVDSSRAPELMMPDLPSRQPLVLWLKILRECGPAQGIDQVLAQYRVRPGSISSNKMKAARQVWRVYRDYEHLAWHKAMRYFLSYALRSGFRNLGLSRR